MFALRWHRADDNQLNRYPDGGYRRRDVQPAPHDRAHGVQTDWGLFQHGDLRHARPYVACSHSRVGTPAAVVEYPRQVGGNLKGGLQREIYRKWPNIMTCGGQRCGSSFPLLSGHSTSVVFQLYLDSFSLDQSKCKLCQ